MSDDEEGLHRSGVAKLFACGEGSVDRLEDQGIIPPRRRLSKGRVIWLRSECIERLRSLPVGHLTERTAKARKAKAARP